MRRSTNQTNSRGTRIPEKPLPRNLIQQDFEIYDGSGWKLGVSQMETVGVRSRKKQMMPYLVDLLKGL
jgi:inorganic pyrophosphatase/exopolyphosphatase